MATPTLILLLLLGVICAAAKPLADDEEVTTTEMPKELLEQQRIDCKLTFDATMVSLEQQQQLLEARGCNVPPTSGDTNKPKDVEQEPEKEQQQEQHQLRRSRPGGNKQPLYESQLVVWPAGVDGDDNEDGDDGIVPVTVATTTRATTTRPKRTRPTRVTTTTPTTTTTPSSVAPLYEDQLVVFPQMDFEEENFDYFFDELEAAGVLPSTQRPNAPVTPSKPVYVLENYSKKHPNGTAEHKLVLSNGLVNYMKHYAKQLDDKVINVQEGYSSVPVAGLRPQIQTLHYIADEHGYNIHKIERSPLPSLWSHRALPEATKAPTTEHPDM